MRTAAGTLLLAPLIGAGSVSCSDGPGSLTVLAAASLSQVLPQIESMVESEHGLDVEIGYAASSTIVQQVNEGAPADLIVLAGEQPLERLRTRSDPVVVATNTLTIAVPRGNPAGVAGVGDLDREGLTLVVCAEPVPCGAAAAEVFEQAGLTPRVASYEPDARATLAKVISGEADAGLVYVTDVIGADGAAEGVALPAWIDVVNRYPAVRLTDAPGAEDFLAELTSDRGRAVLADAGFGTP